MQFAHLQNLSGEATKVRPSQELENVHNCQLHLDSQWPEFTKKQRIDKKNYTENHRNATVRVSGAGLRSDPHLQRQHRAQQHNSRHSETIIRQCIPENYKLYLRQIIECSTEDLRVDIGEHSMAGAQQLQILAKAAADVCLRIIPNVCLRTAK
jgi:hypothetical protein